MSLKERLQTERSVRQEKAIAKALGGRRVAGSGSQPGSKGDVACGRFLIEAKQTTGKGYRLTQAVWVKIYSEAVKTAREPVLVVDIGGRQLAVLDFEVFKALKACFEQNAI